MEQRAQLLLVLRRGDHEVRQLPLRRQGEHPLVTRAVLADQPGPVDRDDDRLVVLADVVDGLVERPLEERRVERDDRSHPAHRQAGRHRHRVLLGDADVEHPVRELGLELRHAGAGRHPGGDPDDPPIVPRELDQLGREDRGVVGMLRRRFDDPRRRCRIVGHRFGRHRRPRPVVRVGGRRHRDRRQGGPVEADLVRLGRAEPAALLGPHVDDRRSGQRERAVQRHEQGVQVVTGHHADVGDPEILEQLARLGEADDRLAQPAAQLEDGPADDRDPLDGPVVRALALAPCPRQLDLGEVGRERPDGRADRHLVVVEDDQHLRLALADVVERLERQSAHQRGVTDDDGDALEPVAQVARLGEALGDRQPGPGMPAIEDVVLRFRPTREAADAIELAQGPEPLEPSRQQLVRVGLVPRVPDDPVARRFEQAVERDRQLDHAERRPEMAAGPGDGPDDRVADLDGELGELDLVEAAQVGGLLDGRQDRHG